MIKKSNSKNFTARIFLTLLFLSPMVCPPVFAETAVIAWDPNPEPDIYGYKVFYGTESRNYTDTVEVIGANNTTAEITDLETGNTYYFAVKAVDLAGLESDFSVEVTRTYEHVNVTPSASFSMSTNTGVAPATVVFESTSSDSDGNIVSVVWDFGDGNTATGASVTHTFSTPGTFNVVMTVTDNDGATAQASHGMTVSENQPPVAEISLSGESGFAPFAVNFSGSASTDADGSIASYTWNFGDGTSGAGAEAVHTYSAPGIYTVTLAVMDDKGGEDSESVQIEVKEGYTYTWVLGENSVSDLTGTVLDTYINMNAENYSESDSLRTYTWPTDTAANAIIMKWNLSALPPDAEIRSASLELYLKEAGGDHSYEITAHRIVGADPVIEACTGETWDGTTAWSNGTYLAQDNIAPAEAVTAVDTAQGFKTWDITSIVRTWKDSPAENYGVLLNADRNALSDSFRYFASSNADEERVRPKLSVTFVTEEQLDLPPRAVASADKVRGKAPLKVNFSASASHDPESSLDYVWDFGDGSPGASGVNATHEYGATGNYTAVVTVTDSGGQTDAAELRIVVAENQVPSARATADITTGAAPLTVLFDAGTSSDPDGTISAWSWDFDNDGVEDAQGMTVEHTFTQTGEYHVRLTVTDDTGATATDSDIVITVTDNQAPVIGDFTATPDALENPGMSAIFNVSVTDPENDNLTMSIDFGNGQSASGLPAQCTYDKPGTYNVSVRVIDDYGNEATATLTLEVTDIKPRKPYNITVMAE